MSSESPRRIIPVNQVKQVPEADVLIGDILTVFQNEIAQIANRSRAGIIKGQSLEPGDARILQGYAKMLVELSKETRERQKAEDTSKMTDAELLEAVQVLQNKIKAASVAPGSGDAK